METFDRKKHWENIYQTKQLTEVSWFQPTPQISLDLIRECNLPLSAKIIDVGGGDSFLVDHLLAEGYQNITVLDISEAAIERAKTRLGDRAAGIKWIVADASQFSTSEKYDLWHDRAAFHFLTSPHEIGNYLSTAQQSINNSGILIMGTFSEQGPEKCSGLEIKQYSGETLANLFKQYFTKVKCITLDHKTPFGTVQNFIFCSFQRI
jgi:2-polyprenyl-3-methyl-5-hydroxy-6-metoxy-1,4-benzoquinol methylase